MKKKPVKKAVAKKVAKKKVAKKATKKVAKKATKKVAKKKVAKKATKKASEAQIVGKVGGKEVKMITADNLPEALMAIAKDIEASGIDLEGIDRKPKRKIKAGSKEALKLEKEWDEYAVGVRAELAGEIKGHTPVKLAMLGAQLDHSWQTAKTDYIKKSMLQLGIDVVTKLNEMPTPEGLPEELVEMKRKSAESVVSEYTKQIELLEAPEREAKEKAEKEYVSAPAGGMFKNVSISDILNAPKADDLPDH